MANPFDTVFGGAMGEGFENPYSPFNPLPPQPEPMAPIPQIEMPFQVETPQIGQMPTPPPGITFGGPGQELPTPPPLPGSGGADAFTRWVMGQESFRSRAYNDYQQTSIGYGTRARPGETSITEPEAFSRLQEELGNARTMVRAFAPGLTPGQENALTDLTFNTGPGWMQQGLGNAVRSGNWQLARSLFLQYHNAGGSPLQHLISRRQQMADALLPGSTGGMLGGGQPQQFSQGQVDVGQDMAGLMGGQFPMGPQAPQPTIQSPVLNAMLPGLIQQPQQRQPDIAGQFVNWLGGGDSTRPPIAQGWLDYMRGSPSGSELDVRRQQSVAEVYTRGQQLRQENPEASPQQIANMLIRDPVWGRNALQLGGSAPQVLQASVTNPSPPTMMQLQPGTTLFQNQGGQVSPTGISVPPTPPADQQMIQWLLSLPPEQRQMAMEALQTWRQSRQMPSDREQAIQRIMQAEAQGIEPSIHDLQLAGYIRSEPVYGPTGDVIGTRPVNTYQRFNAGQQGTVTQPNQPQPTGAGGTQPPMTPPPVVGGMGAPSGIPGMFLQGPGMGQVPSFGTTTPGQLPTPMVGPGTVAPSTGPAPVGGPPTPISTQPTVTGHGPGGTEQVDVPGLSLQPTPHLHTPAEMALGAGPISGFRGLWGSIVGNVITGAEEETLARQDALNRFRGQYATFRQGVRLRGEHEESMRSVPTSGEIFNNPLRATQQLRDIRSDLVRRLQLAMQNSTDRSLDNQTRQRATDSVVQIRGLLQSMATVEQYDALIERLRSGENISGLSVPGFSELWQRAQEAVGAVTSGQQPTPQTMGGSDSNAPPTVQGRELSTMSDQRLLDMFKNPNLTPDERVTIQGEARRRRQQKQQ